MDTFRDRLSLAVASYVLAAALLAGSTVVSAATPSDEIQARLHSLQAPCDKAVASVRAASDALPRREAGASASSAYHAKELIRRARDANAQCPGQLTGHEQQLLTQHALVDQAYLRSLYQTHDANALVLTSLDIQANVILRDAGAPSAGTTSFTSADRQLASCRDNTRLEPRLREICKWQLADNVQTEQRTGASDPRGACTRATKFADEAGRALPGDIESAYDKAHDGLEENKRCTARQDVHDVNQAYLLSWKGAADLQLDIPVKDDTDIVRDPREPGNASPFALSNRELRACHDRTGSDRGLTAEVADQCAKQLETNARLETEYKNVEVPPASLAQPGWQLLTPTAVDPAAYAVRPESQFDWTKPVSGENEKFSVELVRDGALWRDPGSAAVRATTQPWVLFGAIRTWPEFNAMFAANGASTPVTADFFKTQMLVVAVQRKPRQHCRFDSVDAYSVPGTTTTVVPALRIYYRYRCDRPSRIAAGQPGYGGEPAVSSILALPRNASGSVTFLENGASIVRL